MMKNEFVQANYELNITLRRFINPTQRQIIQDCMKFEEGQFFIEKVNELAKIINEMPVTYQGGDDPVVHLHYFIGHVHAWITEKDMSGAGTEQAFGLQTLDGTVEGGELGYISIDELLDVGAEIDLHWTPKRLSELRKNQSED